MTIDELAASTQREFTAVHSEMKEMRSEMATKRDLQDFKQEILRAVEGIDLKMSAYASRWTEDFSKLHDWVKELDGRVKFLEKAK